MKREETRAFQVGNLTLGGNNHVIIQSMTNTKTKIVEATVKQIQELEDSRLLKWSEWLFLTKKMHMR